MLATEQDLIDRATSSLDGCSGRVSDTAVEDALSCRSLSAEQNQVVEELCLRGDGISVLRAPAGTYRVTTSKAGYVGATIRVRLR